MRTFLVLICSFALACVAGGAQEKNKSKKQGQKKNHTQSSQHAVAPGGGPQKNKGSQRGATVGGHPAGVETQKTKGKTKGSQYVTTAGGYPAGAGEYKAKAKTKRSKQKSTTDEWSENRRG